MEAISMNALHRSPREKNLADIGLIALRHGFTRHDVLGPCKVRPLVMARRECIAMFRARGLSTPQIGRIMQRDHSTIVHALQQMKTPVDAVPGVTEGLI